MSHPRPTVDLGYPAPPRGRVPAFDIIEDEAAFWDTHHTPDVMGRELQIIGAIPGSDLAGSRTPPLHQTDVERRWRPIATVAPLGMRPL